MSESAVCFTCGLEVGDPPRLNHTPNGDACPTCRDRLLEVLPAALPRPPWEKVRVHPQGEDVSEPDDEAGPEPA